MDRRRLTSVVVSTESEKVRIRRDNLRARLRADLKVYADAVIALQRSLGKDFDKTHHRAVQARLAFHAAQEKLRQHVDAHDCG